VRVACTILRLGQSFELGMDGQGLASGQVTFSQDGEAGRTIRLRGLEPLPLRKWFRLQLSYDGDSIVLQRDGREEDERGGAGLVFVDPQAEFWISAGDTPVPGRIDSVELFAYEVVGEFDFPESVEFSRAPAALHFAADGSLEPRFHPNAELYELRWQDPDEQKQVVERVRIETGGLPR
jgi:hypothetical protein